MKRNRLEPAETKHFIFRELNSDDLTDIYNLYSEPQVMRFDHSEPIKEEREAEDLIHLFQQSNRSCRSISWGVELKETKKIIGTCGFKNWDRLSHHAEIGGNLSSKYWGKGYGSEMLQFMMEYGFQNMHLNKMYALTNTKNKNVLKVMNRHGFRQEGILRQHQLLEGVYDDVVILALLKNEGIMQSKN